MLVVIPAEASVNVSLIFSFHNAGTILLHFPDSRVKMQNYLAFISVSHVNVFRFVVTNGEARFVCSSRCVCIDW